MQFAFPPPALTAQLCSVFPITDANRSCAAFPFTMKNSARKRYSRHALSTSAYCTLLKRLSSGYRASAFCAAWGTRTAASSELRTSPREPREKTVERLRSEGLANREREAASSAARRSSLVGPSSY